MTYRHPDLEGLKQQVEELREQVKGFKRQKVKPPKPPKTPMTPQEAEAFVGTTVFFAFLIFLIGGISYCKISSCSTCVDACEAKNMEQIDYSSIGPQHCLCKGEDGRIGTFSADYTKWSELGGEQHGKTDTD